MENHTNSLMSIPKNAQLESKRQENVNFTTSSYDTSTKTAGTWISLNWIGAGAATAGFFVFPDAHYATFAVPIVFTILTGVSTLVSVVNAFTDATSLTGPFKAVTKAVRENKSFESTGHIVLKKKVKTVSPLHFFLPLRIFKKQLISEVITYKPKTDTYAKTKYYFTFTGAKKVTEEFAGRRASFKKALDSI